MSQHSIICMFVTVLRAQFICFLLHFFSKSFNIKQTTFTIVDTPVEPVEPEPSSASDNDDDVTDYGYMEEAAAFHYSGTAEYSPAPVVTFSLDDIPHFDYQQVRGGTYKAIL